MKPDIKTASQKVTIDQSVRDGFHRGERWAFDIVARGYFSYITNFIAHLIRDRDRALELAQESFFLACRAHRQYNPSKDLVPWLFQIARNIAYKEYNVRKSGNTVSLDETMQDSAYEPVANTPNPRQQVAEQEMWNRIHKALYRMKPKYRDVLILRLIQGLPSEQVASMLNLPVATVNTHTHRALKTLRELAQKEGLREDEVFS
ncbi:MAG: RNA polymerase sigma factor [bacterium]